MKKNILAIIILAATIVNITLTALLLFTIVPKAQRTDELIKKIVNILNLELQDPDASDYAEVPFADRVNYPLTNTITVNLKKATSDGTTSSKNHYAQVTAVLVLNSKADIYSKVQPNLAAHEAIVESIIKEEVAKYTPDNLSENKELIRQNVLTQLRTYFESSEFLVNVVLNITYD